MKRILTAALGITVAALFSVQAQAAAVSTTWNPTDGNVNIVQFDAGRGIPNLNGGSLALFEAANDFSGPAVVLGGGGGIFAFTDNSDGTFTVEGFVDNVSVGSILMNGSEFMFGVSWDGGATYAGDALTRVNNGDPTGWLILFRDGQNRGLVAADDLAPIPLPASVFLFASALMGLVGIQRRKA